MPIRSERIVLFAIVTVISSLAQSLWAPRAQAQTAITPSGQGDQVHHQLHYLRALEEPVAPPLLLDGLPPAGSEPIYDNMHTGLGCGEACQSGPGNCCGGGSHGCCCPSCMCTERAPCICCPHVSTLNPWFNVRVFGAAKLDMLFNDPRPQAPGVPFFLVPASPTGLSQNTVDIHARQSTLGLALTGPRVWNFQSGGRISAVLFNNDVLQDRYGLLPLLAYGELTNDNWRFAAGLQMDVYAPGGPTVLPFSGLGASGNSGNSFRGSLRLERYVAVFSDSQLILQGALSEPITTIVSSDFQLDEDNGWPNVEGRVALGLGAPGSIGLLTQRPLEIGVSGVVGQLRRTSPDSLRRNVSDVWGVAADCRVNLTSWCGFAGELYKGQGLGTYNGGILQTLDAVTWEAIPTSGGWLEGFVYLTPCLHSHTGYGLDDPEDEDVTGVPNSLSGRTYNSTFYSNLLWDVNASFRIGFEVAYRQTEYKDPTSLPNEGIGFHTQFQWAF